MRPTLEFTFPMIELLSAGTIPTRKCARRDSNPQPTG